MPVDIWTTPELETYIQEGYDALVMATGCLWTMDMSPDIPFAFNYTQAWELDFLVANDAANGPAQFTSEFERDYLNNAQGPANHNQRFEFTDDYVTQTEISALVDLPTDLYEIERATWNTQRLDASRSRQFEGADSRYELNKGPVDAFIQDKDGLRRLRKWRVPATAYTPYAMDTSSTTFGVLVDVSDLDTDRPDGSFGDFVQVAGQEVSGDPFGVIIGIYSDVSDMRYEYRRRGLALSDLQDFEIPERYQIYVRHYAQARALEREGDGQDLELAAHFQQRYEAGVQRMLRRKEAMHYQRKRVLGGAQRPAGRLPLVRLPWAYGKAVR